MTEHLGRIEVIKVGVMFHVIINGRFVSDHSTVHAARAAARNHQGVTTAPLATRQR